MLGSAALCRREDCVGPRPLDRELAKQNPEQAFDSPLDLVNETLLTKGEKIATLNRWRQSIVEQLSASGEGMRTHGVSDERARMLDLIEQARSAIAGEGQGSTS
jgi:hypothetical protein